MTASDHPSDKMMCSTVHGLEIAALGGTRNTERFSHTKQYTTHA